MNLTHRSFSSGADQLAMVALVRAFPSTNIHVVDLPYRLSSWAFDDPQNIGLWYDTGGRLQAWAVLQLPFWTIDIACHPLAERNLYLQILSWADHRARQLLDTPDGHPMWFVNIFPSQVGRSQCLEEAGFVSQADVGEDSLSEVFMERPAQATIFASSLPAGISIRPLAGEGEVEAYVELHRSVFESKNMTAAWRARTLRRPEYHPELDLVAVAPDGRLAAFCIGWLNTSAGKTSAQIEPLGVLPDFRGLGLARAILAAELHLMQHAGAQQIYVQTDNFRNAALALYESAGFQVAKNILVYRKDYLSDARPRR